MSSRSILEDNESRVLRAVLASTISTGCSGALDLLAKELRYTDFSVVRQAAEAVRGEGHKQNRFGSATMVLLLRRPDLQARTAEALLLGLLAILKAEKGAAPSVTMTPDDIARLLTEAGVPPATIQAESASGGGWDHGRIADLVAEYGVPAVLVAAGVVLRKPSLLKGGLVGLLAEGAADAAGSVIEND